MKDSRAHQDHPGRSACTTTLTRWIPGGKTGHSSLKPLNFQQQSVPVELIFSKGHHHTGEGRNPVNARRCCDVCKHQLRQHCCKKPPLHNATGYRWWSTRITQPGSASVNETLEANQLLEQAAAVYLLTITDRAAGEHGVHFCSRQ